MAQIITKKEKGLNRHWKNYIDKEYLGAHNLENGEEMLLTIAKFVGEEEVQTKEKKEPKQVLYFEEDVPKMILNITNATTIASLYGSHAENWIGKQIQVYTITGKFFGKQQDALRVRDFVPKHTVDVEKYRFVLDGATTLDQLKSIWLKLPESVRNNMEVEAHKNVIKEKLANATK